MMQKESIKQLILRNYDLEPIQEVSPLSGGWDNLVYRVDTVKGGMFTIKLYYSARTSCSRLKQLVEILNRLYVKGLSVHHVLETKVGEEVLDIEHPEYEGLLLMSHLPGKSKNAWAFGKEQLSSTLKMLSELHASLNEVQFEVSGKLPARWSFNDSIGWLQDELVELLQGNKFNSMEGEVAQLNAKWQEHARFIEAKNLDKVVAVRTLIHGDIGSGNILFEEGEISGVIDFDKYSKSDWLEELAMLVSFCLMESSIEVGLSEYPQLIRSDYGYWNDQQERYGTEFIELLYALVLLKSWYKLRNTLAPPVNKLTQPIQAKWYDSYKDRLLRISL